MEQSRSSPFRGKVALEAKKQKEQRRQQQKELFAEKYDKTTIFEFPKAEVNMNRHFFFPKIFGPGLFGDQWSKASIAVYPVMCSQANFEHNDWFQISQENIGKMAGIGGGTVQKGIKELVDGEYKLKTTDENGKGTAVPLLEVKMTSEGTRHFYLYRAGFIRRNMIPHWKGDYFLFFACLIDSGIWAKLKPRAKALYLAMRSVAVQDYELYRDVETDNGFEWMTSHDEYIRTRKWDVVTIPLAELGRHAGVNVTNIKAPMKQLEKYRLVERIDKWFKVYLKPRIR